MDKINENNYASNCDPTENKIDDAARNQKGGSSECLKKEMSRINSKIVLSGMKEY